MRSALLSIGLVVLGCSKASPSATDQQLVKPAPGAAASITPGIAMSRNTVAGRLVVREKTPMQAYELTLGEKTVVKTDARAENDPHASGPQPSIPAMFENVAPFDQVAVIRWDGLGNACSGYGYSFLGIRRVGTFALSPTIDFCGGPEPLITQTGGRVTFVVPEHTGNRGAETIPTETWVYESGALSRR